MQVRRKGVRASADFRTRAEAKAWAEDQENPTPRKTVQDALRRFAEDVAPLHKGERWECVRLKAMASQLPNRQLSSITTADIVDWRDARLKKVSASSVRREMNLLASVFEVARREWQWIRVNPVKDARRPTAPRHRDRLISDDERDRICLALGQGWAGTQIRAAFLLALETGMRKGEILAITPERTDLARRFLTIVDSKNGDRRDVPLSARAVEILTDCPRFTVSSASFDALFRKARDAAEVVGVTFHDTRHTALTRLAGRLSVLELARMVGHRDPRSLMIYFNMTAEDLAKKL